MVHCIKHLIKNSDGKQYFSEVLKETVLRNVPLSNEPPSYNCDKIMKLVNYGIDGPGKHVCYN